MDPESSAQFLLDRIKLSTASHPQIQQEAQKIVEELGFLPLAIEQAAAYIRETSKDMFKFVPSYRNSRKTHHARASKGIQSYYKKSVATTWRLSFQQIEENNSDASNLLRLLAFLNPDGILMEFLDSGKRGLNAELREIFTDEDRVYEALGELERFSLIGRQDDGANEQRITIHRLVQSVIKDEMPEELFSTMTTALIGLCDCAFPPWHNWQNELLLQSRRYQDQVITPLSTVQQIKSCKLADLLHRIGFFLREEGKYQQASKLIEKAVKILSVTKGREHPDMLVAMANLGWTYHDRGLWEDAVKLKEKVLETTKLLGEEHSDTLTAMGNLAVTYRHQGRRKDAAKLQETVLEARRRLLGEEHLDTLTAMANLARTYHDQGRWDDTAKLREKVLESGRRLLGEEHPDALKSIAYAAETYLGQGRWDDAAKLGEKVLKAMKRLLGTEHPVTFWAMTIVATTYREQGQCENAAKLEETVLEATIRILGKEHPSTLRAMAMLGCTYRDQGRLDDSIRLLESSAQVQKRIMGDQHPETLGVLNNLAIAYQKQYKLVHSIRLLEMNVKAMKIVLGNEHPSTLQTMSCLARAYREDGRLDDSIKLFQEVLDARMRILGKQHPYTLRIVKDLESAHRAACEGHCNYI